MPILKINKNQNAISNYRKVKKQYYTNIDGYTYYLKSSYEIRYAKRLDWLLKKKVIKKWEYEVDKFYFQGIKSGVTNYTPDFKIHYNDGSIEYHEVKGYMDSKSKTKIKRMQKYYPNIKLIVKDANYFKTVLR